jgi:predicted aminopeptidase
VPEFSLTPKKWCYPVAGCVSYRGYFKKSAAEREAQRLEDDNFDVHMGGVAAYSTLGKFHDPVLNTMMHWDDVQLASLLFHELAHQLLYVKNDTAFNESFATAVEEFGIERFLKSRNESEDFATYTANKDLRRDLMRLTSAAREDLLSLYSDKLDEQDKRRLKQQRIDTLGAELREVLLAAGRNADSWLEKPLNNARIASLSLYEGRLPEFRAMLAACKDELDCFYAESRRIADLDRAQRDAYLDAL